MVTSLMRQTGQEKPARSDRCPVYRLIGKRFAPAGDAGLVGVDPAIQPQRQLREAIGREHEIDLRVGLKIGERRVRPSLPLPISHSTTPVRSRERVSTLASRLSRMRTGHRCTASTSTRAGRPAPFPPAENPGTAPSPAPAPCGGKAARPWPRAPPRGTHSHAPPRRSGSVWRATTAPPPCHAGQRAGRRAAGRKGMNGEFPRTLRRSKRDSGRRRQGAVLLRPLHPPLDGAGGPEAIAEGSGGVNNKPPPGPAGRPSPQGGGMHASHPAHSARGGAMGRARPARSFLICSATRKASSIACSALRRGSQKVCSGR